MFCILPLLLVVSKALPLLAAEKIYYDLADAEKYFSDFIQQYEKVYKSDEEYKKRFEIFKSHLVEINEMNKGNHATFGVTKFADLSNEEFSKTYLGHVPSSPTNATKMITVEREWIVNAPGSLDYRTQNLVTPVKNQLGCGSCFVFSAIGNIEGQYAKKYQTLVSLSEQQGLDCDTAPAAGCQGGYSVDVMNGLAQAGGSEREEDYPYLAQEGTCHTDPSKIVVKVLGGQLINTPTEEELKGALANFGPLAAALAMPIGQYTGGVWSPEYCAPSINHAIVIVGYGTEPGGKDYWIIKNSWGENWGEQGYFRLERGKGVCRLGQQDTANADIA